MILIFLSLHLNSFFMCRSLSKQLQDDFQLPKGKTFSFDIKLSKLIDLIKSLKIRKMVYSFSRWGCPIVSCKKFMVYWKFWRISEANTEDKGKMLKWLTKSSTWYYASWQNRSKFLYKKVLYIVEANNQLNAQVIVKWK